MSARLIQASITVSTTTITLHLLKAAGFQGQWEFLSGVALAGAETVLVAVFLTAGNMVAGWLLVWVLSYARPSYVAQQTLYREKFNPAIRFIIGNPSILL